MCFLSVIYNLILLSSFSNFRHLQMYLSYLKCLGHILCSDLYVACPPLTAVVHICDHVLYRTVPYWHKTEGRNDKTCISSLQNPSHFLVSTHGFGACFSIRQVAVTSAPVYPQWLCLIRTVWREWTQSDFCLYFLDIVKRCFRVDARTNTQSCALAYRTPMYCGTTVARFYMFLWSFYCFHFKELSLWS